MVVRGVGDRAGGCNFKIHVDVWQEPTQYRKAIILQLNINNFLEKLKESQSFEKFIPYELKGGYMFHPKMTC